MLSGSTLQMDGCRFYGNDVVPGVFEALSDSRGAAIYSIPSLNAVRPRNVGGVVSNSVFSQNLGVPVWDVDPTSGPINEMRYDANRFAYTTFGDRVYVNSLVSPAGANVGTLNILAGSHPAAPGRTPKSAVPNLQQRAIRARGTCGSSPRPEASAPAPPLPRCRSSPSRGAAGRRRSGRCPGRRPGCWTAPSPGATP